MSDGKTPCRICREKAEAKAAADAKSWNHEQCKEEDVKVCVGVGCKNLGYLSQEYPESIK